MRHFKVGEIVTHRTSKETGVVIEIITHCTAHTGSLGPLTCSQYPKDCKPVLHSYLISVGFDRSVQVSPIELESPND